MTDWRFHISPLALVLLLSPIADASADAGLCDGESMVQLAAVEPGEDEATEPEESEDEDLEEPEEEAEDDEEEDEDEESFLTQILDNASYELESYLSWFPQDYVDSNAHHRDDTAGEWWNRFFMKSDLELSDTEFLTFSWNATYSTLEGENKGFLRSPGDRAFQPAYVDLETLYVTHEADDYEIVVGKDLVSTGVAELFSPANRFGMSNGANPQHADDMGVWQTRIDYFLDEDTLSFHVMPFEEHAPLPNLGSRWLGSSADAAFYSLDLDTTLPIDEHFHRRRPKNWGYLLHYRGVREGYDFFGVAHHGPSPYAVLRNDVAKLQLHRVYPMATTVGGGVSTVSGAWKYYGEGALQLTDFNRDQSFLKYVLGVNYRETEWANALGLDEIQPYVEYAGEIVVNEQSSRNYDVNSYNSRPSKDTFLGRLEIKQDDEISYAIAGTYNFTDKDYTMSLGAQYKPNDNLTWRIGGAMFGGATDTQLGRWRRNDYVEVGLTYKF